MDTQKYNGWTNYATWMVNVHVDGLSFTDHIEDGTFDGMDKDAILGYLASYIEEFVESYLEEVVPDNCFVQDLVNSTINFVDWHDIADHYVDDILDGVKDRELVAA